MTTITASDLVFEMGWESKIKNAVIVTGYGVVK